MDDIAPIKLPSQLSLSVRFKNFENKYEYQQGVTTIAPGVVVGGGTKVDSYYNFGFELGVQNTSNEPLNFYLKMALFRNVETKTIVREINHHVESLKPGYTKIIDIELHKGEDHKALYLEDIFVVRPEGKVRLEHIQPSAPLYREAQRQIPAKKRWMMGIGAYLFIFAIFGAVGWGIWSFIDSTIRQNAAEKQAVEASMQRTRSISEMYGTWICISQKGEKSDPVTISNRSLTQGGTTVELKPHTKLELNNRPIVTKKDTDLDIPVKDITQVAHDGYLSYFQRDWEGKKGGGVEFTLEKNGKLKMVSYSPQSDKPTLVKSEHTCKKIKNL